MWRASPPCPCRNEGEYRMPSGTIQANQTRRNHAQRSQTECPSRLKKVKNLTYEAVPNSARVKRLCFWPAQAHPRIRHHRVHPLEPRAPLHVRHAERKTKTNVFEVD